MKLEMWNSSSGKVVGFEYYHPHNGMELAPQTREARLLQVSFLDHGIST